MKDHCPLCGDDREDYFCPTCKRTFEMTEFTEEEVTTCKNCKHWHRFRLADNGDCSVTKGVTKDDYYCHEFY